ncbi:MAG TPA: guanylate kinase [Mycobacteriales bacterium]|nr:guanylate kinase [Mycobacteriales bacterium]
MTPAPDAVREAGRLTVLSGPSGVGKSTVIAHIRRSHPQVWLSVSATTRQPRPGETEGIEYHFVDDAQFDKMIFAGEFLEHATFAGNRYGTPRGPVLEHLAAGVPTLLEIDLQGARQVRAAMPEAFLIFLKPPSWEDLVHRLTGRGTEPPEVVADRLEIAAEELAHEAEFDTVVVNESVGSAAHAVVTLMINPPG